MNMRKIIILISLACLVALSISSVQASNENITLQSADHDALNSQIPLESRGILRCAKLNDACSFTTDHGDDLLSIFERDRIVLEVLDDLVRAEEVHRDRVLDSEVLHVVIKSEE